MRDKIFSILSIIIIIVLLIFGKKAIENGDVRFEDSNKNNNKIITTNIVKNEIVNNVIV